MKKLLSIMLTVCMLLTLVAVPVNVFATEEAQAEELTAIDYYKWDFSEEALWTDYSTKNYGGENGYSYTPLLTNGTYWSVSHGTIAGEDALRVKVGSSKINNYAAGIVPLKSDGTPFVIEPGKTYKVKMTMKLRCVGTGTSANTSRSGISPYLNLDTFDDTASNSYAFGCYYGDTDTLTTIPQRNALTAIYTMSQIRSAGVGGTDMGEIYSNKGESQSTSTAYNFFINDKGFTRTFDDVMTMPTIEEIEAAGVTVNEDGSYRNNSSGHNFNNFFSFSLGAVYNQYYKADDPESFKQITVEGEVYSQIYTDCYITELEIIETGCGVTELYSGDTKIDVLTGDEGAQLPLYVPEAPEGKYFYGWYTDKELTDRCNDFTFGSGVNALYACFRDYIESYTENFDVSKSPATQFSIYKSTEVKFPEGTAEETVTTYAKDSIVTYNNTFNLNGYSADGVSDGVQALKGTTYARSGPLLIADDTNSLFIPAPNTKYKVTVTARATSLEEGDKIVLQIGYGIGREDHSDSAAKVDGVNLLDINGKQVYAKYFNSASTLYNTEFASLTSSYTITEVTEDFVTYEFTLETYELDEEKYQSAIGIWSTISGAASTAPNTAEIDSVTIEMVKTTITLTNGDVVTTLSGEPGAPLTLPSTGIIDTNWYTDYAGYEIFTDTIFPEEDVELHTAKASFDTASYYLSGDYFDAVNTQDENGNDVPALLFDGTAGNRTAGKHYRLGIVDDQVTYKLSFAYKAENIENGLNINLATSSVFSISNLVMYVEGKDVTNAIYTITSENTTDGEWKTVDIFFTANVNGYIEQKVEGDDYTFKSSIGNGLFLIMGKKAADGNDKVYMKDFVLTPIENVFTSCGVSILIGEAEEVSGGQALRYYFDYKTEDGKTIDLNGTKYEIVERGIIFRNGDAYIATNGIKNRDPNSTISFKENEGLYVTSVSGDALANCWEYNNETGMLRYSNYVHGFDENDTRELMARGFITFKDNDGNQFTIYSTHVNRSVAYMEMVV